MKQLARRSSLLPTALMSLDHHDLAAVTGGTGAPDPAAEPQLPAGEPAPAPAGEPAPAQATPAKGQPVPGSGKLGCGGHRFGGRSRGRGRGRGGRC